MENVVNSPVIKTVQQSAPYADTAIPIFLTSTSGMKYRTLNCMECGAAFLDRQDDRIYRLNDDTLPSEAHVDGTSIKARCGNCKQWYGVQVSIEVVYEPGGIPLYMQPQSVYITIDETKKLRYLHCLECGRPFHSISDRIKQVVDNRVPFEYVDPQKIGPIEALCHAQNCGQTWALML